MPKILSRQPRWLDHGTPGFNLLQPGEKMKEQNTSVNQSGGLSKKVAHRGTEVFVAVGNELRWSDLSLLKEEGESHGNERDSLFAQSQQDSDAQKQSYMVIIHWLTMIFYDTDVEASRCLERPWLDQYSSYLFPGLETLSPF